jgi:hypothetical protein
LHLLLPLWHVGDALALSKRSGHVHSLLAGAPHGHRGFIAERLVKATGVVEYHPLANPYAHLKTSRIGFEMHLLVFERRQTPR